MSISTNRPKELGGKYDLRGSYRLNVSTGAVTVLAARTATAGQLFCFRWPSSTGVKCFLRYVAAKFILTTAYGTAQETGCDLILAHSFTVNGTNGTAVDVGSTVAHTGKLSSGFGDSLITAGCVRVADTATITAGTQTLDANPISTLSDWSGAIGATVPIATAGAGGAMGVLWDARAADASPIMFTQNQGFLIRNLILMGATGVGRWDFTIEWDEGTPQ